MNVSPGGTVVDGTKCDDQSDSTESAMCISGICRGTPVIRNKCANVTCANATNPCKLSQCNAVTGLCEKVLLADNTTCDDKDPTTSGDRCADGYCSGVSVCSAVVCTA